MPRPAYPPDWSGTIRGLQQGVKAAYTAAQTRVRYAAIRAAAIIVGAEAGNRITIDPDRATAEPRAGIIFDAPGGAGRGELLSNPAPTGEDGWWLSMFSTLPGGGEHRSEMSLLPHRAGIWLQDDESQLIARNSMSATDILLGHHPATGGGYGEFWATRDGSGHAMMSAYGPSGARAAGIVVYGDGRIGWQGDWSPSPTSARTMSAPVDPGPDADTDAQVAYLRRLVTDQADQIAALRERLDQMPHFERLSADEFAHLVGDDGAEEVNE